MVNSDNAVVVALMCNLGAETVVVGLEQLVVVVDRVRDALAAGFPGKRVIGPRKAGSKLEARKVPYVCSTATPDRLYGTILRVPRGVS